MFETLTDKLQGAFKKFGSKGVVTEADLDLALREVRMAMLEADVNFKVVREFTSAVKEKALGSEVLRSLTPAQQIIDIVHQQCTRIGAEAGQEFVDESRVARSVDLDLVAEERRRFRAVAGRLGVDDAVTCGTHAHHIDDIGTRLTEEVVDAAVDPHAAGNLVDQRELFVGLGKLARERIPLPDQVRQA